MVLRIILQRDLIRHTRGHCTALKPVAPISGLIFFLVNKLKILTKKIPPAIDKANAKKPPITIPIVVRFKNASVVMVAPTDNPRKIVAAFMILLEAASNRRNVLVPISFTRLPNINIPIKGTELGTTGDYGSYHDREDNLQYTQILDLHVRRVFLLLFLHVDL